MSPFLERLESLPSTLRRPVDPETLAEAAAIVEDVRRRGETALREHGERLGDLAPGQELVFDRPGLDLAMTAITDEERDLLGRHGTEDAIFFAGLRRDGRLPAVVFG